MKHISVTIHLLSAALTCFVLASLFHTQSMLARLSNIDIVIPIKDKLNTIIADLIGLAPTYGLILLAALSIAFFITSLILKRLNVNAAVSYSMLLYSTAGFVAVATVLMAMHPILNITFLGGARGTFGFLSQCVAGAIGGLLFGVLRLQCQHKTKH